MTRGATAERGLAAHILTAVIREDYGGARRHVTRGTGTATHALCVPGQPRVELRARDECAARRSPGHRPPAPDPDPGDGDGPFPGFLSEMVAVPGPTLDQALAIVRTLADPRDDVAAFEREARDSLRTTRTLELIRPAVLERLRTTGRTGPGTFYETLAAFTRHPVHPTGQARIGLDGPDSERYTPEYAPRFELCWAAVARERVTGHGDPPAWWPRPQDVGLPPALEATHRMFPVHPLTARRIADRPDAVLAPGTFLRVAPTLSVRTVATSHGRHLKLPMPVSTLGLRNRRLLPPGTLADGALVQRLLTGIAAPGGRTGGRVLLADEQTYACTADPMLGFMVRGFPGEVGDASVVPVAALLAPDPGGGHVIERWGVEPLFDAYLEALFAWNVRLFVRYGIALEAHQQNVALVLDEPSPHPGTPSEDRPAPPPRSHLRLLLKDNDAALIDLDRLCAALGPATKRPRFHDPRLVTTDQEALARVFVTITLHLCAGAVAFGLAGRGLLPLRTGLGLVRDRLDEALGRFGPEAAFLRRRTLDADRLPGKAMITAGTLVEKARTGADDINKHYGPPGPNYLRDHLCS